MNSTYLVKGMTCGGCTASIKRAIEGAVDGTEVKVTLEGGVVEVSGEHTAAQVEAAVNAAGFEWQGAAG